MDDIFTRYERRWLWKAATVASAVGQGINSFRNWSSRPLYAIMCAIPSVIPKITHTSMKPDYDLLYDIAESQAGYFTAQQAREVGFSWERLSSNVKNGKFLRVNRGIYRLIHFPASAHEDLFAAWLRTGSNSTISHESALSVYELTDVLPGKIHVIVPRTASRRRKGLLLHTNRLKLEEITRREGLPITTAARTIADVAAAGLAEEQIRQAIREALKRGLASREELLVQAVHRGGRTAQIIYSVLNGDSEI